MNIFLLLFLPLLGVSAPEKKVLSDQELRALAESELQGEKKEEQAPVAVVSTSVLEHEEAPSWKKTEVELGFQSYRPLGKGRISPWETYSFDGLSAKPMLLLGAKYYPWYQAGVWRSGVGFSLGAASHSLKIRTNQNRVYDDVRLTSFLMSVGPEGEYYLSSHWAVGAAVHFGQVVVSQSGSYSSLASSQSAALWEADLHLRFQTMSGFFSRLGFSRRAILSSSKDLGVQENNYALFVGVGI